MKDNYLKKNSGWSRKTGQVNFIDFFNYGFKILTIELIDK